MTLLHAIESSDMVYRFGWAIVHSLWLGAVVAAALALAMIALRKRSSNARYLAACTALAVLVTATIAAVALVPSPNKAAATNETGAMLPSAEACLRDSAVARHVSEDGNMALSAHGISRGTAFPGCANTDTGSKACATPSKTIQLFLHGH